MPFSRIAKSAARGGPVVRVRMDINESRRHDPALRIDDPARVATGQAANLGDPAAPDPDIGEVPGIPGSVENSASGNEKIEAVGAGGLGLGGASHQKQGRDKGAVHCGVG